MLSPSGQGDPDQGVQRSGGEISQEAAVNADPLLMVYVRHHQAFWVDKVILLLEIDQTQTDRFGDSALFKN